MGITNKIQEKLNKILNELKSVGVIQAFKLEIQFCPVKKGLKRNLTEIDTILKKCVKRIISKSKKAEIRNIISELVRKKNLNDSGISQEPNTDFLSEEKSFCAEYQTGDISDATAAGFKFQCNFCNEGFNSKKSFSAHKKVHKNPEDFLCDKCGQIFHKYKKWQQHLEGCGKQSVLKKSSIDDFENEMLTNEYWDEIQVKAIAFETFEKQPHVEETKNSNGNKAENQVAKSKEGKFICACGKGFNILKTFRKHEKLKHSLENIKYNCTVCGKHFLEKGKLNRHMLSHQESQYQCSICSKQFSRSDTLKRHVSLFHYTSREFLCSFCQKKFKLKFNRDVHEENIHKNIGNWVQCQLCGQKFRNKVTLKSHLKIHSDSRITCDVCNKSFSRKSHYKSHMESKHSGAAPN